MATRKTCTKAFKIEAVRLLGLGEKPASRLVVTLRVYDTASELSPPQ